MTRLEQVIAAYLEAADSGLAPDRRVLLADFPDLAPQLKQFFADDDRMNELAEPIRPAGAARRQKSSARNSLRAILPSVAHGSPGARNDAESFANRFGDYELLKEIGCGGMGVVYKAWHAKLDRIVALKMIRSGKWADHKEIRRFLQEAVNAAATQHPNIITIYEVGQIAGQSYISMEYVDGPSLATLLRECQPPPRETARFVQIIAEAVHAAHQRGVLHRDLKPSNILLQIHQTEGNQGNEACADACRDRVTRLTSSVSPSLSSFPSVRFLTPKISDFGLAKRIEGGADLTGSGQILGTPSYMPPEQAAGKHGEIGPASDVYSLGAILYELLTGRPPFRAEMPLDTLMQVLESEPVPLRLLCRTVPRDLETICLKCLRKEPRRRYPSAAELAEDLGRFLAGEPIHARAVRTPERVWRWACRHPGWAAVFAVTLSALVVGIIGQTRFARELRRELDRTERTQRELQIALARQVAERLDSDLRQLASVPRSLAIMLSDRSDWTEAQLDDYLRATLDADPRLFGMCVAFEPYQFDHAKENYARYICRRQNGVELKYLHPPDYSPYRDWEWYRIPRADGQARWSEPYIDTGGGNVPMVTYSVPFLRDGLFTGVVTADLSLAYLRQLKTWLDELKLARGDYGFVISPAGTFISDANPDYQMGRRITEFAQPDSHAGFSLLFELIQRKETGFVKGIDFWTGAPVTFLVAPVPASGWSFVAEIPE